MMPLRILAFITYLEVLEQRQNNTALNFKIDNRIILYQFWSDKFRLFEMILCV